MSPRINKRRWAKRMRPKDYVRIPNGRIEQITWLVPKTKWFFWFVDAEIYLQDGSHYSLMDDCEAIPFYMHCIPRADRLKEIEEWNAPPAGIKTKELVKEEDERLSEYHKEAVTAQIPR